MIARSQGSYHFVERAWLSGPALRFAAPPIPVGPDDPITRAALAAPAVRGLRGWLRFPSFAVRATHDGYAVTIRDVRFARGPGLGLGGRVVHLDRQLRPR